MSTVRTVERRIFQVEGFRVAILHPDGRNVRGDRERLPPYPQMRAMANRSNVKQWKERRFESVYPGFDVDVIGRDGRRVHGGTLLETVRAEYLPG